MLYLLVFLSSRPTSRTTRLPRSELPELITTVASRLRRGSAEHEQPAEERPEPAVSVRRSIRPDHLVCLVCGKPQKMLKRHLAVRHDLTPAQYRERFGLKPDYPMAAPNYAQQRRDLALQSGLVGRRSRRDAGGSRAAGPSGRSRARRAETA